MVALVSEEEADAKRNMEEKLLHLGASVGGLGMADLASRNSLDCEVFSFPILSSQTHYSIATCGGKMSTEALMCTKLNEMIIDAHRSVGGELNKPEHFLTMRPRIDGILCTFGRSD
ncbi:hypothetical protein COP2_017683 [Malus domestica]